MCVEILMASEKKVTVDYKIFLISDGSFQNHGLSFGIIYWKFYSRVTVTLKSVQKLNYPRMISHILTRLYPGPAPVCPSPMSNVSPLSAVVLTGAMR
jgi:hypothetical protein